MSGQKIDDIHLPSFCVKQQRGKRKTKRFQSAAAGAGEHEGCTVELFMKVCEVFTCCKCLILVFSNLY